MKKVPYLFNEKQPVRIRRKMNAKPTMNHLQIDMLKRKTDITVKVEVDNQSKNHSTKKSNQP